MAVDLANVVVAGRLDQRVHEPSAESLVLGVIAHDDGELALVAARRLDREAGHTEHLAGGFFGDRHEGDLGVVVDVAVAHEHRLGDLLHRAEEPVLGRLGRQ